MSEFATPRPRRSGTRPNRAQVGDRVSATLVGTLINYDDDNGVWTLRGHSESGHLDWNYSLHWSTRFVQVPKTADDWEAEIFRLREALVDAYAAADAVKHVHRCDCGKST